MSKIYNIFNQVIDDCTNRYGDIDGHDPQAFEKGATQLLAEIEKCFHKSTGGEDLGWDENADMFMTNIRKLFEEQQA